MTEADIRHYLIVYDIPTGKANVRDFGTDYDGAMEAYAEIEGEMRRRDDLDIVLVGQTPWRPSSALIPATSIPRRLSSLCCPLAFLSVTDLCARDSCWTVAPTAARELAS